ncbi:MAG: hypothetical protein C0503_06805 [Gemmatimonas sp.]|nr:hypothetical protein [Gemmatimonas sp.]
MRRAWRAEGLLRGLALAAVVAAIIAALWQNRRSDDALPALHVDIAGAPSAIARDSLAALARAGRTLTWSGDLRAVTAVAEPLREPVAGWRVAVVGDAALALRDSLDLLDSLDLVDSSISREPRVTSGLLTTEPTRGPVQVHEAGTVAMAAVSSAEAPLGVFVYARAGWESRFAITALEELGWAVDARLTLGRERLVAQGSAAPTLTRHGVIVVFDSATARRDASALQRFATAGGGVVLAGDAAPTRALPARNDSISIGVGDSSIVVFGRRLGRGRLLELREPETWRWRMQGEGAAVEAHRTFWSRLVGVAAPVGRRSANGAIATGAPALGHEEVSASAPRAAVVHALGPERPEPRRAPLTASAFPWWLAPIILLALFTEWASRRRRGAP